jgi:hypothetical protein
MTQSLYRSASPAVLAKEVLAKTMLVSIRTSSLNSWG